ncbi:MAG: PucR family transcriptional regulator ligand-binding domain-containing protein, partial [Bacteroidales bacterium]|nr:PucR family transcriptional regulator ligand-binding domain-containing protein [Bacteroidales bacterium]
MEVNKNITVEEVLKSPRFQYATVVAGHGGLCKTVSWAHILEITECKDYVNGNELILTTGAGWRNKEDLLILIKNLISRNVSALCVQLGLKFNNYRKIEDLPQEVIDEANQANFPLILFPEEHDCRYVDLIRNLHSTIINKDHKTFLEQENFLQELHLLLANPHDTDDILYFIHKKLKLCVAYIPLKGRALFVPKISKSEQKVINDSVNMMSPDSTCSMQKDNLQLAYRKVIAYKKALGFLVFFSNDYALNNFDYMVLEKCSFTLAQMFIGNLIVEEKERQHREQWVSKWLSGRLNKHEIEQYLKETDPHIKPAGCVACLVSYSSASLDKNYANDSILSFTGIARSIFEQHGFSLFWQERNLSVAYLLVNTQDLKTWKIRLQKALSLISELFISGDFYKPDKNLSFNVGKMFSDLSNAKSIIEAAKETMYLKDKLGLSNIFFYDDLHVYRLILLLEKQSCLEEFVMDYLGPIIGKDGKPDKNLQRTLIALRNCQYNKKEAAESLFIARQSLYQRIKVL